MRKILLDGIITVSSISTCASPAVSGDSGLGLFSSLGSNASAAMLASVTRVSPKDGEGSARKPRWPRRARQLMPSAASTKRQAKLL